MAAESPGARPPDGRVSTGNPGLDAMLEGGLVPRRPYLIVGASGTGKTTLALQFLCEGARRGEHVLLVTLEEPPNEARVNHRALQPDLDRVEVFDAIPDIMRYERTPFKDIASVRSATPFGIVPPDIRRTPELSSVEVTITALEQMLRTEVLRRNYTRVVIDSLTALQYFCMKGFDPTAGAQTFLRFLSDLRVTTLLTVESPLEDLDTPERMLARGEIRLFRWELDGMSVRAIGVEKFRGSPHDVRLHPYRIGPRGIDINLDVTISRDTRQILEPIVPVVAVSPPAPVPPGFVSLLDPLTEEVRDLVAVGVDVTPVRTEVETALGAATANVMDEVSTHLARATALTVGLAESLLEGPSPPIPRSDDAEAAFRRIRQRAEGSRAGIAPTELPPREALTSQLSRFLGLVAPPTPPPVPAPEPAPTELRAAPAAPNPSPAPSPEPPSAEAPAAPTPGAPPGLPDVGVVPELPAADAPPPLPVAPPLLLHGTVPEPTPLTAPIDAPSEARAEERALPTTPVPSAAVPTSIAVAPPVATPHEPAVPSVPVIPAEVGASETPAAPKKRRRTTTPRKKVVKEPAPALDGAAPPTPEPTASPPATGEVVPPDTTPAKPKRRAPRKRKAPSVVAAEVVAVPAGAMVERPDPPVAADPPPNPSPPEGA